MRVTCGKLAGITDVYKRQFVDSDADILAILNGAYEEVGFTGLGANNEDALNEISQWLELQNQKMLKTSMGDVQRRYQAIPYGWKAVSYTHLYIQYYVEPLYKGSGSTVLSYWRITRILFLMDCLL